MISEIVFINLLSRYFDNHGTKHNQPNEDDSTLYHSGSTGILPVQNQS